MTNPTVHPDRQQRVRKALTYYSVSAWVTGVWLLVLTTRMILQYLVGIDMPSWTKIIGQAHGIFYMIYLLCTLNLGTKARWQPMTMIITALAGTIPFLSFVAEHARRKQVTQEFQL